MCEWESVLWSSNGGTGIHFILYVYKEYMLALFVHHDEQNTFKSSREELHFSVVEVQRSVNISEDDMNDIPGQYWIESQCCSHSWLHLHIFRFPDNLSVDTEHN